MRTSLAALVPYRGWRRSLLGLLTALALLVAFPAATRAATVSVTTAGVDATCARDGGSCATIARAVEVAQSGDTIQFGAGNFAANTAHDHQDAHVPRRQSRRPGTSAAATRFSSRRRPSSTPTGNGLYVGAEGHRHRRARVLRQPGLRPVDLRPGRRPSASAGTRYATTSSPATAPGSTSATGSMTSHLRQPVREERAEARREPRPRIYADDSADDVTISRNEFRGNEHVGLARARTLTKAARDVDIQRQRLDQRRART